jgi:hypothetical protein
MPFQLPKETAQLKEGAGAYIATTPLPHVSFRRLHQHPAVEQGKGLLGR